MGLWYNGRCDVGVATPACRSLAVPFAGLVRPRHGFGLTRRQLVTVIGAVTVVGPYWALIVAVALVPAAPAYVVMGKFTDVAPDGTVTVAGTVATDVVSLESVICRPPAGAALVRVTVPVAVVPPLPRRD